MEKEIDDFTLGGEEINDGGKGEKRSSDFSKDEVVYEKDLDEKQKAQLSLQNAIEGTFETFVDAVKDDYYKERKSDFSSITITCYPADMDRILHLLSKETFTKSYVTSDCILRYGLGMLYYKEMKSFGIIDKCNILNKIEKYIPRPIIKANKLSMISDYVTVGAGKKVMHASDSTSEFFMEVKSTIDIGSSDLAYLCLLLALENSVTVERNFDYYRSTHLLLREKKGLKVLKSKNESLKTGLRGYSNQVYYQYCNSINDKKAGKNVSNEKLAELYGILIAIKDLRMVGVLDFDIPKPL